MAEVIAKNDIQVYTQYRDKDGLVSNVNKYYSQLDALRALAVLLVIISHWFSNTHILNRFSPNGIIGVTLFFVLSGFLITLILLRSKESSKGATSISQAFKTFYYRRSLRIFPIYYLLIAILLVFNNKDILGGIWSHVFYISNIHFYLINGFSGATSHFWSLAVEEQFYILWPAVLLLSPLRILTKILIYGVIMSIIFRYFVYDPPLNMGRFLMPASLDSFCIGGILAYNKYFETGFYKFLMNWKKLIFIGSLLVSMFFTYFIDSASIIHHSLYYTFISICFAITIMICAEGVSNRWLKPILDNKLLLYIGKISYGMYLYHNFIPYIYGLKLPEFLGPFSMYFAQGVRFIVLLAISSLSWYLFEKQFLKLKDRRTL